MSIVTPALIERFIAMIDDLAARGATPISMMAALTEATIHAAKKDPAFGSIHLDAVAMALTQASNSIRHAKIPKETRH
jgi:hypothetical protein